MRPVADTSDADEASGCMSPGGGVSLVSGQEAVGWEERGEGRLRSGLKGVVGGMIGARLDSTIVLVSGGGSSSSIGTIVALRSVFCVERIGLGADDLKRECSRS